MLRRILGKDPNEVFPYQTERILIIRDVWLAIIGYIFTILVLVYTIVYVFLILGKFEAKATWSGYTFFKLSGKAYSNISGSIEVFDHGDISYPEQNSKGFLIGFNIHEVKGQEIGYCLLKCVMDIDCPYLPPQSYGHCTENGFCDAPSWCPNIESNLTEPEIVDIEGLDNLLIEVWAGIAFPQFNHKQYISYGSISPQEYPGSHATAFRLNDFLNEVGISSVKEIAKNGAIIELRFEWSCNAADSGCKPTLKFEKEDSKSSPVTFNRIYHYMEDNNLKRDYRRFTAVKILLRSYGDAYEFSLFLTVLQISAGLALLKMGSLFSDFIMLHLYPNKIKREAFAAFKTEDSVDFSDKAYKIDYITFLRENRGENDDEEEEEKEDVSS